jgi:imidazolonepropionase-like amidohydrolase
MRAVLLAAMLVATPAAADTVLVRVGRLVDVDAAKVLEDQAVTIVDGRIAAVAPWERSLTATVAAEGRSYRLVDWSAYTVVPGLMDMHSHLIGDIEQADEAAPIKSSAARDALLGVAHARATLRAGFTTVRDVGTYRAYVDVALRDAIDAGWVEGPRMFVAGAYVTAPGGGGEVTGTGLPVPEEMRRGVARGEAQVRKVVDDILDNHADFIKVIATGAVLTAGTEPGANEFSEAELRAAVEEAAKRGTFVAAHAHGAQGIKDAVRAGVRSIEHGSLMDDEAIALMAEHGTYLVADIYDGDYIDEVGTREHWSEEILRKNRDTTDAQRAGFRKAVAAGVAIAFGTDSGVYPHGLNARQFAYHVRYGQTPMQAIQSATIVSARLLRQEANLGSIAPGKFGDLVALACDPLARIDCMTQVAGVIKGGVSVPLR